LTCWGRAWSDRAVGGLDWLDLSLIYADFSRCSDGAI